jgi:hypothetical protein
VKSLPQLIPSLTILCFLSSAVLLQGQTESDPQAIRLLTAVSQRMVGTDLSSFVSLTETDGEDTVQHQEFHFWVHYPEQNDSIFKQTRVELLYPDKARGQKLWSWQMRGGLERSWVYLPGSGRLREVSHRSQRQRDGYDIGELEITPQEIEAHISIIVRDDSLQGRPVTVIKSITLDDSSQSERRSREPSYKLLWVDPEAKLVRKAEFYTPLGRLLRRITLEDTEIHNHLELVTDVKIWDPRRNRHTDIAIQNISLEPIQDEHLFQPGEN